MSRVIRLGTRASALALAQSRAVAAEISGRAGVEVELATVTTHGDVSSASLATIGGSGVFASALREALLAGECDVVVHSFKDLPTASQPGLTIAAVPKREDACDALCARDRLTLGELAPGARVGTGSPRRRAQVLTARPDLTVADIRGNVDTRLSKVRAGEFDAVILAAAGLRRLDLAHEAAQLFELADWPTAAGQGALALEARSDDADADLLEILAMVDDEPSRITAGAERAVLAGLEAGCAAPVGLTASLALDSLSIRACVYNPDGTRVIMCELSRSLEESKRQQESLRLAADLVRALFDDGAAELAPGWVGT
jgi:hydroxymethylbilane synthase